MKRRKLCHAHGEDHIVIYSDTVNEGEMAVESYWKTKRVIIQRILFIGVE